MTEMQTVLGPVGLDELGETMVHEHVFFWNWGQEEKRAASLAYAREELNRLARCGARTVVDVGPLPERDVTWYQELAPQLDLHVVLCTGFIPLLHRRGFTGAEVRTMLVENPRALFSTTRI